VSPPPLVPADASISNAITQSRSTNRASVIALAIARASRRETRLRSCRRLRPRDRKRGIAIPRLPAGRATYEVGEAMVGFRSPPRGSDRQSRVPGNSKQPRSAGQAAFSRLARPLLRLRLLRRTTAGVATRCRGVDIEPMRKLGLGGAGGRAEPKARVGRDSSRAAPGLCGGGNVRSNCGRGRLVRRDPLPSL
jgi:hypothetical protein